MRSNSTTWHASMAIHFMTTQDISIYLLVYHSNYRPTSIRLWVRKQKSYSYFNSVNNHEGLKCTYAKYNNKWVIGIDIRRWYVDDISEIENNESIHTSMVKGKTSFQPVRIYMQLFLPILLLLHVLYLIWEILHEASDVTRTGLAFVHTALMSGITGLKMAVLDIQCYYFVVHKWFWKTVSMSTTIQHQLRQMTTML